MELKDYGMSRERGFLSHYEVDEITLPSLFDEVKEAAGNLSGLLSTGRVRHWLDQLADPGLEDWAREAAEEEVRTARSEEHTSELQSRRDLVCRLLLEKKKQKLPSMMQ